MKGNGVGETLKGKSQPKNNRKIKNEKLITKKDSLAALFTSGLFMTISYVKLGKSKRKSIGFI